MTHAERQALYWIDVATRTRKPAHVRAAEFWLRVATLAATACAPAGADGGRPEADAAPSVDAAPTLPEAASIDAWAPDAAPEGWTCCTASYCVVACARRPGTVAMTDGLHYCCAPDTGQCEAP